MKKIENLFLYSMPFVTCSITRTVCPVCTIAVGAGVSFSKWLGIDDTITGIWIGGFAASMIAWTVNFLTKHHIRFYGRKILVTTIYFFLILWPLYYKGFIGNPHNTLWGMDKLLFGIATGTILFTIGAVWYNYLKKRNNGHAYFPFQKIVMPIGMLIIASFIFYFIVRCYGR
jgi:hypothetical protein